MNFVIPIYKAINIEQPDLNNLLKKNEEENLKTKL